VPTIGKRRTPPLRGFLGLKQLARNGFLVVPQDGGNINAAVVKAFSHHRTTINRLR
jgi:hypothetical protein